MSKVRQFGKSVAIALFALSLVLGAVATTAPWVAQHSGTNPQSLSWQ